MFGVAKHPEPLMRGDQAFNGAAPIALGRGGAACQHHFEHMEEFFSDFIITLITGVMKRNQDFIRQPAAIAWRTDFGLTVMFVLGHSVLACSHDERKHDEGHGSISAHMG